MATNHQQAGMTLDYANSSGSTIASGAVVVVGNQIGIAHDAIPDGQTGVLHMDGVWVVPKTAGTAIANGAALAYDASAGEFTAAAGFTPAAGDVTGAAVAWGAAASAATTMAVKINTVVGTVA